MMFLNDLRHDGDPDICAYQRQQGICVRHALNDFRDCAARQHGRQISPKADLGIQIVGHECLLGQDRGRNALLAGKRMVAMDGHTQTLTGQGECVDAGRI